MQRNDKIQEKRKYPRISKSLSIKLSDKNFYINTETKNISCNGLFCAVDTPIEPMTKLDIVLFLKFSDGKIKKIHCKGVVVRTEAAIDDTGKRIYCIGVYFNQISNQNRKLLSTYIESHLEQLKVATYPQYS